MDLTILQPDFTVVNIFDVYKSLIWTERYCAHGDFEIYTPLTYAAYTTFKADNYIKIAESKKAMVIETAKIITDKENGDMLLVRGTSLESLLKRRIIWGQKMLYGNLEDAINNILCDAIIEPSDSTRTVPNFTFVRSSDSLVTSLTVDDQVTTENVYEVIKNLCELGYLGFELYLNTVNHFNFRMYAGVDRSYSQMDVPWVVFSPEFDNLLSSEQTYDKEYLKTVTLVLGAGEGADRPAAVTQLSSGTGSGWNRRELYTDASDISLEVEGVVIPPEDYAAQLVNKGNIHLSENTEMNFFDGRVSNEGTFIYDRDFGLGDIVQIENNYGDGGRARVTEIVRTKNSDGVSLYPTFTMIT